MQSQPKVHKFWEKRCASPLQSFVLQACSEIFDGIWDRKLKLCFSESQDNNNNNNNNNNNDSNNEEKILLTTMLNVKILFTIN